MSAAASPRLTPDRAVGALLVVLALVAPLIVSEYWVSTLLTQTMFLGIVAASLIFLSADGGMVSLAQVAIYGVAGFALGNLTTTGNTKGLNLGWEPVPGILMAIAIAVVVAFIFGVLASRSYGIYFLMITLVFSVIANLFFGQVTSVSGFGGISGIPIPGFFDRTAHPDRLYFATLLVAALVYLGLRYVARTPFGLTLQGIRDDPVRMRSLGYSVTLHRLHDGAEPRDGAGSQVVAIAEPAWQDHDIGALQAGVLVPHERRILAEDVPGGVVGVVVGVGSGEHHHGEFHRTASTAPESTSMR